MYRTEYSIAHRIPETLAPIRIAPASSKMVAITQACRRVNTLAPTDRGPKRICYIVRSNTKS